MSLVWLNCRRPEVDLAQKRELVAEMNGVFSDAASIVVTHYSGLTVAEINDLRGQMREAGANFKVTKNRLVRLALADTVYAPLMEMFSGPTRSEEHTSELQSRRNLVCRLLLEKKKSK